jgi:hypothetical protein
MYSSARRSVHEISNKYNLTNVGEVKLTVPIVKTACNANKSTLAEKRWAEKHAKKIEKRI